MTESAPTPNPTRTNKRLLIAILAAIVICGCAACLVFVSGMMLAAWTYTDTQNVPAAEPNAWVSLMILPDGCRVHRTEVEGPDAVDSLTWVISDLDGNVLLERNAEGEMVYGYFQGGQYRVHVKGWFEGRYHVLSDEVTVTCP